MNLIVRVINIRKHKKVTFLDVHNSDIGHQQIKLNNSEFIKEEFKLGDIIECECDSAKTEKGIDILNLKKIYYHNHSQIWVPSKTLTPNMKDHILRNQIQSLNGGPQIKLFELRQELEREISKILDLDNFLSVKCKLLEPERTSAGFQPIKCKTFDNLDLYLRVTMENQLKQMCAMMIKSLYSIDTVFYDVSIGANFQKEINTLEFIAIDKDMNYLTEFIKKINKLMTCLIEKYGFTDIQLPPHIDICEFKETDGNTSFINDKFQNNIVLNVPVESPFIKWDPEIGRTETRWYVNGQMVGHGYEDETDYERIKEVLDAQKQALNIQQANEMDYINWGMPRTVSWGMGVDLLTARYLGKPLTDITNPLGINYKRRTRNGTKNS